MRLHASCAALGGAAVLVTGPPGSGKSDLVLRLLDHGFTLVADDQVMITGHVAEPPEPLRGLLEVRGLGIVRLTHLARATLRLVVRLRARPPAGAERLPMPATDRLLGLPCIDIDPFEPSAATRVTLALRCATGAVEPLAGAFAA